ncbi:MAG: methyl-accepting chemotaxis protein [Solibacillus sp.]
MASINYSELDESLQYLIHFAPTLKKLFTADVAISISDLETVVLQLHSKELSAVGDMLGHRLTEKDPMIDVMRRNREQMMTIPREYYGVDLKVAIVPITNKQGKVVGSLGVSSSIHNRVDLIDIADKFASSSEEIGASTEELTVSASNLSQYMTQITTAQEDLAHQVANSSKILDMINNVAKNTRILGFNAGIEAARSGEHGRGFAVVAKEITKLADQSGESVNEIRQLLDVMKAKVEEVSETVNKTLHISENQTAAIIEISSSIQQLTEVAEKIDDLAQRI